KAIKIMSHHSNFVSGGTTCSASGAGSEEKIFQILLKKAYSSNKISLLKLMRSTTIRGRIPNPGNPTTNQSAHKKSRSFLFMIFTTPVHSKKSILCGKTAHIDCAEANYHFEVAIRTVPS